MFCLCRTKGLVCSGQLLQMVNRLRQHDYYINKMKKEEIMKILILYIPTIHIVRVSATSYKIRFKIIISNVFALHFIAVLLASAFINLFSRFISEIYKFDTFQNQKKKLYE